MVADMNSPKNISAKHKEAAALGGSNAADLYTPELANVLAKITTGDVLVSLPDEQKSSKFGRAFEAMQAVIREQKKQLDQLSHAREEKDVEAHHRRALEEAQALTHLGSWEWDVASDTILWSDELYRIYGLRPQEREIDFKEFIKLIHPEDSSQVQDIIAKSFKNGLPFEFEHRIILPSGKERILKGMGKAVHDENHNIIRMLGTSHDITQEKQLDRAKDEFISLVSHQLRTPLTIVRMHGSILEDGIVGTLDEGQAHHIRTMTAASVRLIELVDNILRISNVSLDRIQVNAKPTEPNSLINACIEEIKPMAEAKNVTIDFTADKSLGLVSIDVTIFGEILRNLMSNAVRYAPQKDGMMKVDFTKDDKNKRYVLKVSDNGIGIEKTDQTLIFERFYRANNATMTVSEGTGLGLYIVKLFSEAAGGKVWLESTVGEGTSFYVSFPARGMSLQAS